MDKPKYFEDGPLPLALGIRKEPQFFIYKIEPLGNDVKLYYLADEPGISIYAKNEIDYKHIAEKIKVVSGGWYGTEGRWRPLERYDGALLCKDVKTIQQISLKGHNFSFNISKGFFSLYKTLEIENEIIGKYHIKFKMIKPQDFEVLLFSNDLNQWVKRSELLKMIGIIS